MSKAQNALAILKKNLGFQDMLELIELLSVEVEKQSQNFMKESFEEPNPTRKAPHD